MAKDIMMTTSRASLCALGEYLRRQCFFAPLQEQVQLSQKTVRYRPIDKVLDGLLGILCGAKTISQRNVTIRVGLLLDSRVVGFADVVQSNCCHPFLLEALLFQEPSKGVVLPEHMP